MICLPPRSKVKGGLFLPESTSGSCSWPGSVTWTWREGRWQPLLRGVGSHAGEPAACSQIVRDRGNEPHFSLPSRISPGPSSGTLDPRYEQG